MAWHLSCSYSRESMTMSHNIHHLGKAQLDKMEVSQNLTGMVGILLAFSKFVGGMEHLMYYQLAVEFLKVAVTFQLQMSKIDLAGDAHNIFKNDVKHTMVYQLCAFLATFNSLSEKLQNYKETRAADDGAILSICPHGDLVEPLRPLMAPEDLIDALRRQCSQYQLRLESMMPALSKTAGYMYLSGEQNWKAHIKTSQEDIDNVIEVAMGVLPSVPAKTVLAEVDKFMLVTCHQT